MSLAHDGPPRPCPIPNCEAVFQDWEMTPKHLARDHDHSTRMQFKDELWRLNFRSYGTFSCPICHYEPEYTCHVSVLSHCQEHDKQQLLRASKTLFDAWSFSLGPPTTLTHRKYGYEDISLATKNKLLAGILLSDTEWSALGGNDEALEQAGAKLRASMEVSKDGSQN